MAAQPYWRLNDHGPEQELRKGQGGGKQEDETPGGGGCQVEAHSLGDHDANNNGELSENAWNAGEQTV